MTRSFLLAAAIVAMASVDAFTISKPSMSPRSIVRMAEEDGGQNFVERGVSVDQDGKSNVWAIEPKVEIESKSSEEKTTGALVAAGGLIGFGAAAAFVLTNLPDPNQF